MEAVRKIVGTNELVYVDGKLKCVKNETFIINTTNKLTKVIADLSSRPISSVL